MHPESLVFHFKTYIPLKQGSQLASATSKAGHELSAINFKDDQLPGRITQFSGQFIHEDVCRVISSALGVSVLHQITIGLFGSHYTTE